MCGFGEHDPGFGVSSEPDEGNRQRAQQKQRPGSGGATVITRSSQGGHKENDRKPGKGYGLLQARENLRRDPQDVGQGE